MARKSDRMRLERSANVRDGTGSNDSKRGTTLTQSISPDPSESKRAIVLTCSTNKVPHVHHLPRAFRVLTLERWRCDGGDLTIDHGKLRSLTLRVRERMARVG